MRIFKNFPHSFHLLLLLPLLNFSILFSDSCFLVNSLLKFENFLLLLLSLLCGFIDRTASEITGWETRSRCSEDRASEHGTPALLTELMGAPNLGNSEHSLGVLYLKTCFVFYNCGPERCIRKPPSWPEAFLTPTLWLVKMVSPLVQPRCLVFATLHSVNHRGEWRERGSSAMLVSFLDTVFPLSWRHPPGPLLLFMTTLLPSISITILPHCATQWVRWPLDILGVGWRGQEPCAFVSTVCTWCF